MVERILSFFKKFPAVITLVVIESILFWRNFVPNTYIVGWDNVMPEFNLSLNFQRALTAVWQDYRGLGTLDGMAHAANLTHTIYIWLLNLVLTENAVRFTFLHLTHLAGGIALYFLALKLLRNNYSAFLASIFYMLNLGIIQMYFAPLEVFAMHFAALPIMGLALYNAIEKKTKSSLALLGVASFLTSSQGFVPTVFIAYSIFVAALLLFNLKKIKIKRAFFIVLVIFLTNAFWMLPFTYSALNKSQEIQNTRINEFSSEEIYYLNHARGSISDVLTLKGFMIDTIEYNTTNTQNEYFMSAWRTLQESVFVAAFSWIAAITSLFGIFLAIKYRIKNLYPLVVSFSISFIFLANNAPVFSQINNFLRDFVPLFGEAFRFPFTKFITLFAFSYAILFSVGISFVIKTFLDLVGNIEQKFLDISHAFRLRLYKISYLALMGLVVLAIFYQSKPAFENNFTSPILKLALPQMYKNTNVYFEKEDKNGRILTMPMSTFWNWQYRSWGHRGSGFMWYGISQPMIERAFDPWSLYNEQLYNEIAFAQTQNDITLFDSLLEKYDIAYILLDESVLNTLSPQPIDYGAIEEFLSKSTVIKLEKRFDDVLIYKTVTPVFPVYTFNSLPTVDTSFVQSSKDTQYEKLGNYIVGGQNPDLILPFPSLSTLKLADKKDFDWEIANERLIFKSKKTIDAGLDYTMHFPSIFEKEFFIPVEIIVQDGTITLDILEPEILINGQRIENQNQPVVIYPTLVTNPTVVSFLDTNHPVDLSRNNKSYLINNLNNTIKLSDGVNEEYFQIDTSAFSKEALIINAPQKIESFEVSMDIFESPFSAENIILDKEYIIARKSDSSELLNPQRYTEAEENANGVKLLAKSDSLSVDFYMADLFHQGTYAVIARTNYESGLPINFYVDSPQKSKAEIETKFGKDRNNSIVILPATDDFQRGYGFHFGVKSIGGEIAASTINEVNVYPILSESITSIALNRKQSNALVGDIETKKGVEFSQSAKFYYDTKISNNTILTLSQSYDKGFAAYEIKNQNYLSKVFPFIFGTNVESHTIVNNWANAWTVNPNTKVIIVYLPQYLEFTGLFLLLIFVLLFIPSIFKTGRLNNYFDSKSEALKQKIEQSS